MVRQHLAHQFQDNVELKIQTRYGFGQRVILILRRGWVFVQQRDNPQQLGIICRYPRKLVSVGGISRGVQTKASRSS